MERNLVIRTFLVRKMGADSLIENFRYGRLMITKPEKKICSDCSINPSFVCTLYIKKMYI